MATPRVLYWFRTDLRLHDSPALTSALSISPSVLYPIFTSDPHYVQTSLSGPNRWQFLLDCLSDLSSSITKLNPNSKLLVIREAPQTVLPKLFKEWQISHLVFEKDTDPYARQRDVEVRRLAEDAGVEVIVRAGRTLWDSESIVRENGGRPTMSIREVQKAGDKVGPIQRPLPAPTGLPDLGDTRLSFVRSELPQQNGTESIFVGRGEQWKGNEKEEVYTYGVAGPKNDFAVPLFSELGISEPPTTPHRGGETLALHSLTELLKNKHYISTFSKPSTAPTAFNPPSTTLLSPHLHFGSLSVRYFYHCVQDIITSNPTSKKNDAKPPTNLTSQLVFRDMYFAAHCALGPKFSQTLGNPKCNFIPWHLPSVIDSSTGLRIPGRYQVDNPEAEEYFHRWAHGRTGFPFIDAIMRQLKHTGWIHHLARHMTACFLTRGGCYIDWERGADIFARYLIDHEECSNIGNWQWLACTAFFSQFQRVYSPVAFGKKWDPHGHFVRHWVPELANYSEKYIYEPWKAPIADKRAWGCLVQGDGRGETLSGEWHGKEGMKTYPKPMLDFAERREICIKGMKKAYEVGFKGDDARVLNGTWRSPFPDEAEGPTQGTEGLSGAMVRGTVDRNMDGLMRADGLEGKGERRDSPLEPLVETVSTMSSTSKAHGKRRRNSGIEDAEAKGKDQLKGQLTLDNMITRKKAKT